MNDIRSLLKLAARRIEFGAFLSKAHWTAIVLSAIALTLMIADRTPAASFVPWTWVAVGFAVLGMIVAVAWWSARRRSELQVALAVDERLDLKEKMSTALHCHKRTDPFACAAVEDAVGVARDARTRERARRNFRIAPPPAWWLSPLLVFLAVMISFIDPLNLWEDKQIEKAGVEQARVDVQDSIEAVVKEIESRPELSGEVSDLLGDLTKDPINPDEARDPLQIKRDAIKKVGKLERRLDEIINGEKGKTVEALERSLRNLQRPKSGAAKELAEALAKGDFATAKKALEEMLAKANDGTLTKEQVKEAAEQLKNIAEQLDQLSKQQKELEAALRAAGMDEQLAKNPQALQQALKNNQNLNEQQLQQLQQMAQAQQAANQMMQSLGQSCQGMAQSMMDGQFGQGQGQGMSGQLSQMEQMQMLLQQAQAASGMCQGQAQGLGQGMAQGRGGMGGRGQGRGGKASIAPTPTGTRLVKADVETTDGDIIARQLIDGPAFVGESKKRRSEVIAEVVDGFDEALTEDELPRKYHEAHQHYFGELKKLAESIKASDAGAEDAGAEEGTDDEAPADGSGSGQ